MSANIIPFARSPFVPRGKDSAPPPSPQDFKERALAGKRDPNVWKRWRAARRRTELLAAYREFVLNCQFDPEMTKSMLGAWASFDSDAYSAALDAEREAIAQQLMTPAPTREAVNWKKRQKLYCLSVTREEVAQVIEADEQYLRDKAEARARRKAALS